MADQDEVPEHLKSFSGRVRKQVARFTPSTEEWGGSAGMSFHYAGPESIHDII